MGLHWHVGPAAVRARKFEIGKQGRSGGGPEGLPSVGLESLEPRVMFNGANGLSVALIDVTLPGQAELAAAIGDARKVTYDPRTESAAQVLKRVVALSEAVDQPVASLMVFSHGSAGVVALGDDLLSAKDLGGSSSAWGGLGRHLARGGSIELFACSGGKGTHGKLLVEGIHHLTGANVFASDDDTGAHGNWNLEVGSNGRSLAAAAALPNPAALKSYAADLLLIGFTNLPTANPSAPTGTTASLSTLAFDILGSESNCTYTWSVTTKPTGSSLTFSANGTNASKNTTATFTRAGTYILSVTVNDAANVISSSAPLTIIVGQTVTSITVTPGSAALNENATQAFTASGTDQFGQTMSPQPSFTWAKVSGSGSINALGVYTAAGTAGSATVTASSGGVTSNTASVTVTNAAPTVGLAASAPAVTFTSTAGLSVLGADDGGESNLIYTWSVTSKPTGAANPTFNANGTNAAKDATATFTTPGAYTFLVTIKDPEGLTATSSASTTVNQTLTSVGISPVVSALSLGGQQQFTATAYDQLGVPMVSQPTFTWSTLGAGSVSASGLYTAPAAAGLATVTAASGLFSATAAVTVVNATSVNATPSGTTAALSVTGAGTSPALTYTWSTLTKPTGAANATFSASGTLAAANTTATFNRAGAYTLQVVISDGSNSSTDTIVVTAAQTLASIAVTPGSAALNENATQAFTASGSDQFGQAMLIQPAFTWAKASGVGSINALGVYSAPGSAGSATVTASSGGITSAAASVAVTDAAPTIFSPASTSATVLGSTATLAALGADDGGESNLTYTWSVTSKPTGATAPTFSANGTHAAKLTTATFSSTGAYAFLVTITDPEGLTTTSSVSTTVVQTLSSVVVTPLVSALSIGGVQQFTATGYDLFGAPMQSQPTFTWSSAGVGSVSSSGVYTAPATAGLASVTATAGLISGTAAVTVANGTSITATPNPVTGSSTALGVIGQGASSALTYTWSATLKPTGAANPTFSANGTGAAASATATFSRAGSYTLQVVISDGANSSTDFVVVTVAQTLTSIAVTPGTASLNENAQQAFTAVGSDQFGQPLASQPLFTWAKASGVGSINALGVYTAPGAVGSATLTATSGGVTSNAAAVTITDAAPTVAVTASTSATILGTTASLNVLGADDGGESNLTYTWSVTDKPAGAANPTFSANGTNAAKASTATFSSAGAYSFLVTIKDPEGLTTTSNVGTTVAQTMASVATTPATATVNIGAQQQFAATAYDQFGAALATQPTFAWVALGAGTVSSTGMFTAAATTGSASVTAAYLTWTATSNVTVANGTSINAPASPITGTSAALNVTGAGSSSFNYTWVVTSRPAGSPVPTFSANASNAAASTTVAFARAGSYTLQVIISDGLTSSTDSVALTVSQALASVVVTPGTASLNENQQQAFSAQAFDQFGQALAAQPTFAWAKSSGTGSIDATGLYTAPGAAGVATITATSGGVVGSAAITTANAAPTVAAAASAPALTTGTTATLTALGADDGGESHLTYTWTVTGKPLGATAPTFSANGTNAAKSASATFYAAGSYTFLVTIKDAEGLTVTSSVGTLVTQTVSSVSVSQLALPLPIGGVQQFTATAYDQFGTALVLQPIFSWSLAGAGSLTTTGLYIAPAAAGSATVTATAGGVSGSAAVSDTNTTSISTVAAGLQATLGVLGVGASSNLSYNWSTLSKPSGAADPVFSANGTGAAANVTSTFNHAGNYTLQVVISDGLVSTTDTVTLTIAQALTSVVVTPAAGTLSENATQQFTATALDQFGLPLATQPSFAWGKASGVGSISATGLFTAPGGAGSATITATTSGVSGSATVTVSNAAPTIASATGPASPATGATAALSARGADDGGEGNLTYTWSLVSKPLGAADPTYSANASHAARDTTATFSAAGVYVLLVTTRDPEGLSATAPVTVTVAQTLTSITVTPSTATVNENVSQAFSATGYDQFGAPLLVQPTFTWSKVSGVGSLNASGVFTAPASTGSATITASSGGVTSNAATVTVNNAGPTIAAPASMSPIVLGTTAALSALGADDGGESNLTYTWSVTSKPTGAATPTFSANGTNAAKGSTATFTSAGAYAFLVTIRDADGATVTSTVSTTVTQTMSGVTLSPTAPALNIGAQQQFTASAYDQFGNALATQPTFAWSALGAGSISQAGLFTASATSGTASVSASYLTWSATANVTVSNNTSITAPAGAVTGTTAALSIAGASSPSLTYTWIVTSRPTGAPLPMFSANGSSAAVNTVVSFAQAGSYTVQAVISDGVTSSADTVALSVNQTLASVVVSPGSTSLNENQQQAFSAISYDQFGQPLATQPAITWSKSTGAGSINASGVFTAPGTAGTTTITATVGSVSGNATVTTVDAAPAVSAAATAPAVVTTASAALAVLGADDGGESNLTYTWTVTGKPTGATTPTFAVNGSNAAKSTTATFFAAGAYTFLVTMKDAEGLSVTSTVSTLVTQTISSVSVSQLALPLPIGGVQQFTATASDQFGAALLIQPAFSWSLVGAGNLTSTGLYTSPAAAGSATVTATANGVSGSGAVSTTNGTSITGPGTVLGATANLGVWGVGGATGLTFNWTTTGKPTGAADPIFSANGSGLAASTTATFNRAGTYTVQVVIGDGAVSTTDTLTLNVSQTLTSVAVTPAITALNENATQQFSAVAYDQFAQPLGTQPSFTWAKASGTGSISAAGLYTAPGAAGSATITATTSGVSGSASVTVSNGAPAIASATGPASPVTGTTAALSARGVDDGGEANLTYTWSLVTKPPGAASPTFSANASHAARDVTATFTSAGVYAVLVTVRDAEGLTATSQVTVTVAQTLSSITATPSNASMNEGATQAFGATGYDQFGAALLVQPTFAWAVSAGLGSVNGAGVFTSASFAGSAVVTASSGGLSANATVTVFDAAPTVVAPASALPATVAGLTTTLSALGTDDGSGEAGLTYTWAVVSKPAGASDPSFAANASHAASTSVATFSRVGTYVLAVTIRDAEGASVTSNVTVTVVPTLTRIALNQSTAALNENAQQAFSATAYDQFNQPLATQPTFAWTVTAGLGGVTQAGVFTSAGTPGTSSVTATVGLVSATAVVTVTNALPTIAQPAAGPATVSGTTAALTVLGADDGGEANLTYAWSVVSKPVGAADPLFSLNGFNAAKQTVAMFSAAGAYTFLVTITDAGGRSVGSIVSTTVNPTLSSIAVTPAVAVVGPGVSQTLAAAAYDQFGTAMATQPSFTWSLVGPGTVNSAGVYVAPASTGVATVSATAGGVSGSATVTTASTVSIVNPGTVTGGSAMLGVSGAVGAGITFTWSVVSKPTGAADPAFSVNASALASSPTVSFNRAGSYVLRLTLSDSATSSTQDVSFSVAQTMTSVAVTPLMASLNENGQQQLTATAYDQFGQPMAQQPTFTWTKLSGVGSVSASGLYTAPASSGAALIAANAGAFSGTAAIAVSDAAPTIATPASAPSPVTGTTAALSVLGADDGGESRLTYTWATISKPLGATDPVFSDNGTPTAKGATATFSQAGTYSFLVTVRDPEGLAAFSTVNVTVNQALGSLTVTPTTASVNENGSTAFTASAFDQFGRAMATQPAVAWRVDSGIGSISSTGVYTAPGAAGAATIVASSGAVSASANVTVTNATPTVALPASASPLIVTGNATTLSALGADDGGEANLNYTWAVVGTPAAPVAFTNNGTHAGRSSIATFAAAGTYLLQVTISDGNSAVTSNVTVVVAQTLGGLTLSGNAAVPEHGTTALSAAASDQFGNPMALPLLSWAVFSGGGSIDASGVYTAGGSAGSATVTASALGVSGSLTINVANAAPTVVQPAAIVPGSATANSVGLSALGADDGTEANLTYTWSVVSKPAGALDPLILPNGTHAGRNATATFSKAGTYSFVVTLRDLEGSSVTSGVTVSVSQALSRITVSPSTVAIPENGTAQLSAVGFDQFGDALAVQPTFNWSTTLGTISGGGLLTGSPSAGAGFATANASGVQASVPVTVTNAAPTFAVPPSANPSTVTGDAATLTALGSDDGGEANLTYTWGVITKPLGAANPTFSANATNAAKLSTVTFSKAGVYVLSLTEGDVEGRTFSAAVTITVLQTPTTLHVTPPTATIGEGAVQPFGVSVADQFGDAILIPPAIAWTATIGTIDAAGLFTAPNAPGTATITATAAGLSDSATVTISADAPTIVFPASGPSAPVIGATANLSVLATDVNGGADINYTWSLTSKPLGAANATFSANGTNAASNTTATFSAAGAYTFLVSATDANGLTATSLVVVTVAQTLTSASMTPSTASLSENAVQQLIATGQDQFGATMLLPPTFAWSVDSGLGSVTQTGLYTAPATATVASISATSNGIAATANVTVSDTAPVVVLPATAGPVLGTTVALTALGADDNGESNLTYAWAAVGQSPAGVTFSANGSNAAKAVTATFSTAGTYTFACTISDGQGQSIETDVTVVVPQTVASVVVTSSAPAPLPLNGQANLTATAYDLFGQVIASPGAASWTTTLGSVDGNGVYTAPASPGAAVVTAAIAGVSGSFVVPIVNTAPVIISSPHANPSPVVGLSTTLHVDALDDGGLGQLTYLWSVAAAPVGAPTPTFSVNGTPGADDTTVTFGQAGEYRLAVTVTDAQGSSTAGDVLVEVEQTASSITVTPTGSTTNERGTVQLGATEFDQFANPMATQPAFNWSTVGGGFVDATGLFTAGVNAGTMTVTANAGAVSKSVSVIVQDAAPTIVSATASATQVTDTSVGLSALGADDGGENRLTYTWAVVSKPNGAANPLFSVNGLHAAANATATFGSAGDYTFQVTVTDPEGLTVAQSVTVTVNQTPTGLTVGPISPLLNLNQTAPFTASVTDQFGAAMAVPPAITWSVTGGNATIDSMGLLSTGTQAGPLTLTASENGQTRTLHLLVIDAIPALLQAATGPGSVTGTTAVLSASAVDDSGPLGLTYTWSIVALPTGAAAPVFSGNGSASAGNLVATFSQAGSYTFACTISDGTHSLSAGNVTVQVIPTATSISLLSPIASLNLNETHAFAASVLDQFGLAMTGGPALTWSATVGSIDANGVFAAPSTPGSAVVSVETPGGLVASETLLVTDALPTIVNAITGPLDPTGTIVPLSALGADDGGESNLRYLWSVVGSSSAAVTFSAGNGTHAGASVNAQFSAAGIYTLRVQAIDASGQFATGDVVVNVPQLASAITLSTLHGTMDVDRNCTMHAAVLDQFGAPFTTQPTVTWSIDAGGVGTIDANGVYSSPTPGTATVRATLGGLSGTLDVAVVHPAPIIVQAPSSSPSPVTGVSSMLSALATDIAGTSALRYTWTIAAKPAGAPDPIFSTNGTAASSISVLYGQAGAYTFALTVGNGDQTVAAGDVTVNVEQTVTSLVVSPSATVVNLNGHASFVAAAFDQFGNALAVTPQIDWSAALGTIDSSGSYQAPATPGTDHVTATLGNISQSVGVSIADEAPTIASATAVLQPGDVAAALEVVGMDDEPSTLTYAWSVVGTPPGVVTFTHDNLSNGRSVAHFTAAGHYVLQATVTDSSGQIASATVTVDVPQLATSVTATAPGSTAFENQAVALTASQLDQFGIAMATQPAITWSVLGGVGSVNSSGLFVSATPGQSTLRAAVGDMHADVSLNVVATPPTIVTAPSAAPATVTGTSTTLSVAAHSDAGNAVLTYHWSLVNAPAGANAVFATGNGSHAAATLGATFDKAGTYTFQVAVTDADSLSVSAQVVVTVQSTPTTLNVVSPITPLNEGQTASFGVALADQFGNAMPAPASVDWTLTANSVGTLDASGNYTAPTSQGSATIRAEVDGLAAAVTISVVDQAPTITSPPAAATASDSAATLSVAAAPASPNAPLTYTWSVVTEPTGAAPVFGSANGTGTGNALNVTFDAAGDYTFAVAVSDGTLTTTRQVSLSIAQTLSSLTVNPSTLAIGVNQETHFTAVALDQFGAPLATQPTIAWTLTGDGSITAHGLYTAPAAGGSAAVTATVGAVSASAPVTIQADAPVVVQPASGPQGPVTGTTAPVTVEGTDNLNGADLTYTWSVMQKPTDASDPVFSSNGTTDSDSPTVTFDHAGVYRLLVTIHKTNGTQATSDVTLTVEQALSGAEVTAPSLTVTSGGSERFTAVGLDQFGDPMTVPPTFTWSTTGGGVDADGLFTAPAQTGSVTLTATAGQVSAAAAVRITDEAPTVVTPPTVLGAAANGTTVDLAALGQPASGNDALTYTWSTLHAPAGAALPEFSDNGTAAHTQATFHATGEYTLLVTITDTTGAATTSSVTFAVDGVLTRLGVTAPSAEMNQNARQRLDAVAYDQFGAPLAAQPTFTWTSTGPGAVDANGNFTTAQDLGRATITASAGGLSASTDVDVVNAAPTIVTPLSIPDADFSDAEAIVSLSATDDGGESNLRYSWTVVSKPHNAPDPVLQAVLEALPQGPNPASSRRSATVRFGQSGLYVLLVTVTDAHGASATSRLEIHVRQRLTSAFLTPAGPTIHAGSKTAFTLAGIDQFGLPMTVVADTAHWATSAGTISRNGLFVAPKTTGPVTISATANGLTTTTLVQVDAAPITLAATATLSGAATVALSATSALNLTGLTLSWAIISRHRGTSLPTIANGASTTATLPATGKYVFEVTATDSDGATVGIATTTVTVVPVLTQLLAAPATPTVVQDKTVQFVASGLDQFGLPIALPPGVRWTTPRTTVGKIDASGLYTAPITGGGPAEVTATLKLPRRGRARAVTLTAKASASIVDASHVPVAYTRLSILRTGKRSVQLMWQPRWADTFDGGFRVEQLIPDPTSPAGAGVWRDVIVLPAGTYRYAISNRTVGNTYTYRIRAFNTGVGTASRTPGVTFTMPKS